jgi:hypothetical protein
MTIMSGGRDGVSWTDSLSLSSVGFFSNNSNGPSVFCGLPLAQLLELYTAVLPAVFSVSVFCRYQICWIFGISVSIDPPFFVYFPLSSPLFPKGGGASQKGGDCPPFEEKGGDCPPFEEKGGHCPLLIPKCTDRIFLRYRYGKYREIPTEYRPKIPNRYTTLPTTNLFIAQLIISKKRVPYRPGDKKHFPPNFF